MADRSDKRSGSSTKREGGRGGTASSVVVCLYCVMKGKWRKQGKDSNASQSGGFLCFEGIV